MMQPQTATAMAAALEELLREVGDVPQQPLLADDLRFRYQLSGGDTEQPPGRKIAGVTALASGALAGTVGGSLHYAFWSANRGIMTRVLALCGRASVPVASIIGTGAAAALAVAAMTYAGLRLWQRRRQALTIQMPRYLSCPLNTTALAVASLLATPALQVVREVSTAPDKDQAFLAQYLSQEWGYEETVAQTLIQHWGAAPAVFHQTAYQQVFQGLVTHCPEVHRGHLRQEILSLPDRLPSGAGQKMLAQTFYLSLHNLLN